MPMPQNIPHSIVMVVKAINNLHSTIDTVLAAQPDTDPQLIISALLTAEHNISALLRGEHKEVFGGRDKDETDDTM